MGDFQLWKRDLEARANQVLETELEADSDPTFIENEAIMERMVQPLLPKFYQLITCLEESEREKAAKAYWAHVMEKSFLGDDATPLDQIPSSERKTNSNCHADRLDDFNRRMHRFIEYDEQGNEIS
jgi:hypothetical protein